MPILPPPLGLRARVYDPDASIYFSKVEAADGQPLEQGVRNAINNFVLGCKSDGVWTAIVACCILAGARTVAGAVIPLVGNAPTSNNITDSDYSRTLGILGNDSNKWLNTGYASNNTTNFPQNDCHISCYISQLANDGSGIYIGDTTAGLASRFSIFSTSALGYVQFRIRSALLTSITNPSAGFFGAKRDNSSNYITRASTLIGYANSTVTSTSGTPAAGTLGVLATGGGATPSNGRISFYSVGKALDLELYQARVDSLLSEIASSVT